MSIKLNGRGETKGLSGSISSIQVDLFYSIRAYHYNPAWIPREYEENEVFGMIFIDGSLLCLYYRQEIW